MTDKTPSEWQIRGVAIAAYSLAIICAVSNNKWSLRASNVIGGIKVITLVLYVAIRLPTRNIHVLTNVSSISIAGLVVLGGNVHHIPDPKANFRNAFEGESPNGNDLSSALVSIVFSYAGYANAFNVVNEIKNPIPTLKRNTSIGLIIVFVLYFLCNIAYFAVVPKAEFAEASQIAASLFFAKLFKNSNTAADVLNFLVALSAFGNILAYLIGGSRAIREIGR